MVILDTGGGGIPRRGEKLCLYGGWKGYGGSPGAEVGKGGRGQRSPLGLWGDAVRPALVIVARELG